MCVCVYIHIYMYYVKAIRMVAVLGRRNRGEADKGARETLIIDLFYLLNFEPGDSITYVSSVQLKYRVFKSGLREEKIIIDYTNDLHVASECREKEVGGG